MRLAVEFREDFFEAIEGKNVRRQRIAVGRKLKPWRRARDEGERKEPRNRFRGASASSCAL